MNPNKLIHYQNNVRVAPLMEADGTPLVSSKSPYGNKLIQAFLKEGAFYYCLKPEVVSYILCTSSQLLKLNVGQQVWNKMRIAEYQNLLFPMVVKQMRSYTKYLQDTGHNIEMTGGLPIGDYFIPYECTEQYNNHKV